MTAIQNWLWQVSIQCAASGSSAVVTDLTLQMIYSLVCTFLKELAKFYVLFRAVTDSNLMASDMRNILTGIMILSQLPFRDRWSPFAVQVVV